MKTITHYHSMRTRQSSNPSISILRRCRPITVIDRGRCLIRRGKVIRKLASFWPTKVKRGWCLGKVRKGRKSSKKVVLLCHSLPLWLAVSFSKRGRGLILTKMLQDSWANKNFKMFLNLSLISDLERAPSCINHWHQALLQQLSPSNWSKKTKLTDRSTSS